MCGGSIIFNPGEIIGICDHCGTRQSLDLVLKPREELDVAPISPEIQKIIESAESALLLGDWEKALKQISIGIDKDQKCLKLCEIKVEALSMSIKEKNYPIAQNKKLLSSVKSIEKITGKSAAFYYFLKEIYEPVLKGYVDKFQQGLLSASIIFGKDWCKLPYETVYKEKTLSVKLIYEDFCAFCDYLYPSENAFDIILPIYNELNDKAQIFCDRIKLVNTIYKEEVRQYYDYIINRITYARNRINILFPEKSHSSGKLYIIGFSKSIPAASKVFIKINGSQVGEVERGEVFEYEINSYSTIDLRYSGDYFWKETVAVMNPGDIITLKLNCGFNNYIEARTHEKPFHESKVLNNNTEQNATLIQRNHIITDDGSVIQNPVKTKRKSPVTLRAPDLIYMAITILLSITPIGLMLAIFGIIKFTDKSQKIYRYICVVIVIIVPIIYLFLFI